MAAGQGAAMTGASLPVFHGVFVAVGSYDVAGGALLVREQEAETS